MNDSGRGFPGSPGTFWQSVDETVPAQGLLQTSLDFLVRDAEAAGITAEELRLRI